MKIKDDKPQDLLKVCNCSTCGKTITGLSPGNLSVIHALQQAKRNVPPMRNKQNYKGRPVCEACYSELTTTKKGV